MAFSPDGTLLADADGNGNAYVWHAATDELAGTYTGTSEVQVWGVAFSPDGKLLAIADGDGNIYPRPCRGPACFRPRAGARLP